MSDTLFVCLFVLYAAVSQRKISTLVVNKDLFYSILNDLKRRKKNQPTGIG